jgi:YesN/AraC family two-component response regulator
MMTRVLIADDDENIRAMLQQVLKSEGFTVTTASTVPQALALISQSEFEVLISDLNMGHPADGFVIVSAMRRTHPDALTFILTGYPDFDTALEATRQHVNDYLVKATPIEKVIEKIKAGLANGRPSKHPVKIKRVPDAIEESREQVLDQWLQRVKANAELSGVTLSDAERRDHVPALLDEAVAQARDQEAAEGRQEAAERHGAVRYKQGYSIPMLISEARLLQDVIGESIRNNFLLIDLSNLISDMTKMSDTITNELAESARAFMEQYAKN